MKYFLAMLVVTVMLAIFKLAGWTDVSWLWVLSPFWLPMIEGVFVRIAEWMDD